MKSSVEFSSPPLFGAGANLADCMERKINDLPAPLIRE